MVQQYKESKRRSDDLLGVVLDACRCLVLERRKAHICLYRSHTTSSTAATTRKYQSTCLSSSFMYCSINRSSNMYVHVRTQRGMRAQPCAHKLLLRTHIFCLHTHEQPKNRFFLDFVLTSCLCTGMLLLSVSQIVRTQAYFCFLAHGMILYGHVCAHGSHIQKFACAYFPHQSHPILRSIPCSTGFVVSITISKCVQACPCVCAGL